jgi:phosphate-selective porin
MSPRMKRSSRLGLALTTFVSFFSLAATAQEAPATPEANAAATSEANRPEPPSTAALRPIQPPPAHGPLAGYGDGTFFLRDPHDWFVLFPKGRLQLDGYFFLNRGSVSPNGVENSSGDTRPRDTATVRRARVELVGTMFKHFDFQIAGEWATIPGLGSIGGVTDAFVIVDYLSFLKLQVGQFDAPFTMENRTSDKWFDFMERSLAVRAFGVPANKDIGAMIWGWTPRQVAYYSFGVFNGDGMDFKAQANAPALIGRAFVAPLAWMQRVDQHPFLKQLWVGASIWWQNDNNIGGSVTPNVTGGAQNDITPMTTQGGYTFFNSNYANGSNAMGQAIRSHLTSNGTILKWALEANLPVTDKYGLRFEYVHQKTGLAEYDDTNPTLAKLVRSAALTGGSLDGYGLYLEAFAWIIGDIHFTELPGVEPMPRVRDLLVPKPKWALMLAAKYERLAFDVGGLPTAAMPTGGNMINPAQGHYQVDAFELGVNAWATKHVRMTVNYVLNHIDGTSTQAIANYYHDRNDHEFLMRLGINL